MTSVMLLLLPAALSVDCGGLSEILGELLWGDQYSTGTVFMHPTGEKKGPLVSSEAPLSVLQKECKKKSLRCYMLELLMVIDEEAVIGTYADCISDFNANLPTDNSVSPAGSETVSFLRKKINNCGLWSGELKCV